MPCSSRIPRLTATFAVMLAAFCSATRGQTPPNTNTTATPAPGAHDYLHSQVETVNPANGSVSIRIPVRMPPGRQLTVPFAFAYDSNGAFYIGPPPTGGGFGYNTIPNSVNQRGGWSYSFPVLSFQSGTWTIPNSSDGVITCHGSFNYVFQDPGGNRHNLGLSVSANVAGGDGVSNCNQGVGGDGEFATGAEGPISAATTIPQANTPNFPSTSVVDGNGTGYAFSGAVAGTYLASNVVDRNGNTVAISNSSGAVTYTDTIGRTALHSSGLGGNPDTITLGGLSSPYKTYWTTASANFTDNMINECTGAGCGTCPTSLSASSSVVSQIVLPNGQQFTFTYDPTYGMLQKIVYPTGGYVRYVWGLNSHSDQGQSTYYSSGSATFWNCRYDFPAITDRYVSFDGSAEVLHQHFAYSTTWGSSAWTSKQTTVTTYDLVLNTNFTTQYTYSPLAADYVPNCFVCSFNKQTPVEQTGQYYDTTGSLLRTETKTWKNLRLMATKQVALDNGQSSFLVNCYDGNEQVTETDEYDLGTGTPSAVSCLTIPAGAQSGALLRKTATSYATFAAAHIVDMPATLITYDGSGNRLAETDTYYDQTGSANRGNPTTITKQCVNLPGSSPCSQGNSSTTFTYDSTGQMLTTTDPRGNQTSYSYTDSYASCGGTAPPTTPSNAYLTQVTYPATNGVSHIVKNCYDYSSGLLLSSTDQNNLVTTYKYVDSLDRLTETDIPDGGKTTVSYNDTPPSPTITTSKKINGSGLTVTTMSVLNGLGMVKQTQLTSDPQGTVYTDTTFDGLGRVHTVSNPYRAGNDATSSPGTTTFSYDAFGRKRSTTFPDNSVLTSAYCGQETLVTDPTKRWRRSRVDGLGRLVEVDEPNSSNATVASTGCPGTGEPIWVTSYSLDALSNLLSVVQNGSRQRSFTYDSLGRLLTSANPEVGTITYTYDLAGNASTKKDARNITTTYSYDALNRNTGRTYSNGDPTVTINYDESNCLGLSPCQNVGHSTSMTDAQGSEAWAYQVNAGTSQSVHVNQRTTQGQTKTSTYYFDLAGNITQMIYPSGRVVNYLYDNANRPKSATDGVNGLTYATGFQTPPPNTSCVATAVCYTPQGTPYAVSVGQSSTFTGLNITESFNNRLQPNEIRVSSTGGNAMDITYGYTDPVAGGNAGHVFSVANNLDSARSQSFGYDQLNRIVSAQTSSTYATSPTKCWGEAYTLDPWANLTSIAATTNPAYTGCSQEGGFSQTANTNNRLSGFQYDASGNTTNDGVQNYFFNAESQMTYNGIYYGYDGALRRVAKTGGYPQEQQKLYWYGSGGEILTETNPNALEIVDYVYFGGRRVAQLANDFNLNGGFESGLTNWSVSGSGTATAVTNAANAHSGSSYAELTTPTGYTTTKLTTTVPISAQQGEVLTATGWVYREVAGGSRSRWWLSVTGSNGTISAAPPDNATMGAWIQETIYITIPSYMEGPYTVTMWAEVDSDTSSVAARFDDATLNGQTLLFAEDSLGSTRVVTDTAGVVCYDADFYPYGGERPYTNTCTTHYKFEGKERDNETGNDYFGARYYSNRFGRWLSSDWSATPVAVPYANLTNPQTLNLYSMVSDDPESFADLDGHIRNCLGGCGDNTDMGAEAGINLAYCSPGGYSSEACETQATAAAELTQVQAQQQAQQTSGQQASQQPQTTSAQNQSSSDSNQTASAAGAATVGVRALAGSSAAEGAAASGAAEMLGPGAAVIAGATLLIQNVTNVLNENAKGREQLAAIESIVVVENARLIAMASEHKTGARESTREKHEEGQTRRARDRGGEKGDQKRPLPRRRPPGHKGPWPPPGQSTY